MAVAMIVKGGEVSESRFSADAELLAGAWISTVNVVFGVMTVALRRGTP